MRCTLGLLVFGLLSALAQADPPRVFPPGQQPADTRLGELRNLNGYFPFKAVSSADDWQQRQSEIQRRILVSQGLWPMPTKTPLEAVIHGRVERPDYTVDRVYFQSAPGHYVTGSLYRPKGQTGPRPAILSPHGHWDQGRFYDAGPQQIQQQIESGAESFAVGGRYPLQARAVHLARLGCIVFLYDMTGYADSIQLAHRPEQWSHLDRSQDWGFMSVQAELRLQNMMGLQTWNSIRALDFLLSLEDVDPDRIGVTGASGGGTQSMIHAAIDPRIAAAMPCVMVSTAMQGGCTCENAPLLRVGQGNIDIAAAIAPRPLGLTAADDWTKELETKGYPELRELYAMLGHPERLMAVFHTQFPHNYNQVNRQAMYEFFNRAFELGHDSPITESDYQPLTREQASVWTEQHPAPSGDAVGDSHEVKLLQMATRDSQQQMQALVPQSANEWNEFKRVVGGGWQTILGRSLDEVGEVTFVETAKTIRDGWIQQAARLEHAAAGEQLPVVKISPTTPAQGTVIWVTATGKAGLYEDDGLNDAAASYVAEGYRLIAADLLGQGEFVADGSALQSQPMWYQMNGTAGWHRFAGYTYGYNPSLFAQRVHDILSLIKLAQQDSGPIQLMGLDATAGPLVAAAAAQAGDAVDHTVVQLEGFRFEQLDRHDHPMFAPGAVKYLDVEGLLALVAPSKLTLRQTDKDTSHLDTTIIEKVFQAAGAGERLNVIEK